MKIGKYLVDKVHLADSYQAIKELPGNCLDCIYTDIPYLYKINKQVKTRSPMDARISKKKNEILNISNGIRYDILDEFVRVMKKVNIVSLMIYFIIQCRLTRNRYFHVVR